LPMITYHAGQLILDTLIADRMRSSAIQGEPPL